MPIEHFLLVRLSDCRPAQIILERFMGPFWKDPNTVSLRPHHSDQVSDLVDDLVSWDDLTKDTKESPFSSSSSSSFTTTTTTTATTTSTTDGDDNLTLERQESWRQLVLKLTMPTWNEVMAGDPHTVAVRERHVVTLVRIFFLFLKL